MTDCYVNIISRDDLIAVIDGEDRALALRSGDTWWVWPASDYNATQTFASTKDAMTALREIALREAKKAGAQ